MSNRNVEKIIAAENAMFIVIANILQAHKTAQNLFSDKETEDLVEHLKLYVLCFTFEANQAIKNAELFSNAVNSLVEIMNLYLQRNNMTEQDFETNRNELFAKAHVEHKNLEKVLNERYLEKLFLHWIPFYTSLKISGLIIFILFIGSLIAFAPTLVIATLFSVCALLGISVLISRAIFKRIENMALNSIFSKTFVQNEIILNLLNAEYIPAATKDDFFQNKGWFAFWNHNKRENNENETSDSQEIFENYPGTPPYLS
jgi:hypothetical protein